MDLFRKKSVDQLVSESTPLKRTLKTFDLTMLGIGAEASAANISLLR